MIATFFALVALQMSNGTQKIRLEVTENLLCFPKEQVVASYFPLLHVMYLVTTVIILQSISQLGDSAKHSLLPHSPAAEGRSRWVTPAHSPLCP